MPGFSSHRALVTTSQKLLAAVAANADQLQAAEPLRTQLEQAVTEYTALITRRDTLKADKQVLSKRLPETAQRVNDLAIDLKAMLKATLGSRSEKLTEFDLKPRRKVLVTERSSTARAATAAKRKRQTAPQTEPDNTPAA